MSRDLGHYLQPARDSGISFQGKYPADFLSRTPLRELTAWHLVGGLDILEPKELTGTEPQDGYPNVLPDWIQQDGLKCLKIKLRGDDAQWDYARLARVGHLGATHGVDWLSADFNCTVQHLDYVNGILDRLRDD